MEMYLPLLELCDFFKNTLKNIRTLKYSFEQKDERNKFSFENFFKNIVNIPKIGAKDGL